MQLEQIHSCCVSIYINEVIPEIHLAHCLLDKGQGTIFMEFHLDGPLCNCSNIYWKDPKEVIAFHLPKIIVITLFALKLQVQTMVIIRSSLC